MVEVRLEGYLMDDLSRHKKECVISPLCFFSHNLDIVIVDFFLGK